MKRRDVLRVAVAGIATPLICRAKGYPVGSAIGGWQPWLQRTAKSPAPSDAALAKVSDAFIANTPWKSVWGNTRPSTKWARIALNLVVKYQRNPIRAARALALIHAAMHDALLRGYQSFGDEYSAWIAAHRAATKMLAHLFPQESPHRYDSLGTVACLSIKGVKSSTAEQLWEIGCLVGEDAIARSRSDGAGRIWSTDRRPPPAPGQWRPAPPLNVYNPLEPLVGQWRPWVLSNGAAIDVPAPTLFDSAQYWEEVLEAKRVAESLTPQQKAIANNWDLNVGSVTPGGVWNLRAMGLIERHGLDESDALRILAALNIALVDAFICCWHTKYKHWTQRPITAIRDRYDPNFLSYVLTPPFPSYASGHSTASGAAQIVLAHFFPEEADSLRTDAEEAAVSRLYGGIHFRIDNDEGLKAGRKVGTTVVEHLIKPLPVDSRAPI